MKSKGAITVIALVQAVIGFEWAKAGWEKVSDPNFVSGLEKTLGFFASKNPTGWYKDLLSGTGAPNATLIGWLVAYGELIVGIALLVAAVVYLFYGVRTDVISRTVVPVGAVTALIAGAFLNANFWFAAGWTSVAADSVNTVMFLTQLVLVGVTITFISEESGEEPTDEEIAWQRLFKPTAEAEPTAKEPAGMAH